MKGLNVITAIALASAACDVPGCDDRPDTSREGNQMTKIHEYCREEAGDVFEDMVELCTDGDGTCQEIMEHASNVVEAGCLYDLTQGFAPGGSLDTSAAAVLRQASQDLIERDSRGNLTHFRLGSSESPCPETPEGTGGGAQ